MGKAKEAQVKTCNRYCFRGFCESENGPRVITLENGERIRGDWETGALTGDSPARKCWNIDFGEPKRIVPCTISLQVRRCNSETVALYEGDIVRLDCELEGKQFLDVLIIEWDDELCGYAMRSLMNPEALPTEIPSEEWFSKAFTVIGNRWENSDLLEAAV